jgi:antitoxin ParD1/3/4
VVGNLATKLSVRPFAVMANVEKLSVALTPDMAAEVRSAVEAGDYGSVSEVVRDALCDWRPRRKIEALETAELRRLVHEGMNSGPGLDADLVFTRLRALWPAADDGTLAPLPLATRRDRSGGDRRVYCARQPGPGRTNLRQCPKRHASAGLLIRWRRNKVSNREGLHTQDGQ